MKQIVAFLCIAVVLSSCQRGKDQEETAGTLLADTLLYQYDSIKVYSQYLPKKMADYNDTTQATISYPVFKNDTLNNYIKRQVFNFFAKEEPVTSYQDIANSFIKGYDDFSKEYKDRQHTWYLNIKISVLRQTPNYIALQYIHSDYAGGAHGNTYHSFLNYNPKTNEEITLDSLIRPDKMAQLTQLAESIFRKNENLSPDESLAGKYFFENDKFALAQNFYVRKEGLYFLYNPYEIKPYVSGTTALIIPASALKDIAQPHTILSSNP